VKALAADTVGTVVERLAASFASGRTRGVRDRLELLLSLEQAIRSNESRIGEALSMDLGKSAFESYGHESGLVLEELRHIRTHLRRWARPKRTYTPLHLWIGSSRVYREPYGVVLIIAPWNYPFLLTMSPLVGALSAGNCVVIKPSEYAPATASVVADIVGSALPAGVAAVVQGDAEVSESLVNSPVNYIFYTGGAEVGKNVMRAASERLCPVTLELGGKSPCLVAADADIEVAARRIVWGKFLNAGQTCVCPDYVYVHETVRDRLLAAMKENVEKLYGEDPGTSPDYGRIIHDRHFDRLSAYLSNGSVVTGGRTDRQARYIAPTILTDITWEDPVMQEEIFGPILPVLTYRSLDEVTQIMNSKPRPLALYIFTRNRAAAAGIIRELPFGGGCVNDTVMHIASFHLPFGGTGSSGMGGYHGRYSFETFSHRKGVLFHTNRFDLPIRYPPYRQNLPLLKRILG
jgi:aldehyde dehydrogenase (NAD+)